MPARKTTPPSEISFYGLLMWRGKEYPYETLLFNWQSGQYFILGPGPLKAAGMTLKVPNSCWVFLFTNPFFKLIGTRSKQSLFCLRLEPDKKVLLCYLFPVWKEIRSAFFEKPHQRFLDLFYFCAWRYIEKSILVLPFFLQSKYQVHTSFSWQYMPFPIWWHFVDIFIIDYAFVFWFW